MSETEDARKRGVALAEDDGEVLRRYRRRFTRPASAQAFEERFRTRKRVTNTLEVRALRRALRSLGDLGRVLDVPAGAGRFLPLLREKAREVVGSDVSAEMLQLAGSQEPPGQGGASEGRAALVEADLFALPFAEGSFDAVVCIRFLHHLPSGRLRVGALRELARVSSRYVVVSFFDYVSVWALRQAWRHLRGKVKPGAIPLARFQAEAAQAGLRFVRSVHVLPGLSEEQVLVFAKDPAVASTVEETPQSVSRRLRVGHWLNATAWLWAALLGGLIFLCRWRQMEDAEVILWPIGIVLMLAGAALLVWTFRCRRSVLEQLGPSPAEVADVPKPLWRRHGLRPAGGCPTFSGLGPHALSRHPALLGVTLWLCGFAFACELWWLGLAVWLAVPGGLWLAMEYTEARGWLHHGHRYDLYAQGTPLFLPNVGALRSLWWQALSTATPGQGSAPGQRVGRAGPAWSAVGVRALVVAGAGAALALLKEMAFS